MQDEIAIQTPDGDLGATLSVPPNTHRVVIFAHGSGSSRFSARNRFVAEVLFKGGFATLLMDLLTTQEDRIDRVTAEFRFDIPLLAKRLLLATEWATHRFGEATRSIGYFGASTGAGAALIAAAEAKT